MAIIEVLKKIKERNIKAEKDFTYLLRMNAQDVEREGFEVSYKRDAYNDDDEFIEEEGRLLDVFFNKVGKRIYLRIESDVVYEDGLDLVMTASEIVRVYVKERLKNTEEDNAFWTIDSNNEYLMAIILEKSDMANSDFLISTKEEEKEGESYVEEITSRNFFPTPIGAAENMVSFIKSLKNEMEKSDDLYFKEWEFAGFYSQLQITAVFFYKGIEFRCLITLCSETECRVDFELYDVFSDVEAGVFNLENQSFDTMFNQYLRNHKILFSVKKINQKLSIHNIFREVFKYVKRGAESIYLGVDEEEFLKETSLLGIDNVSFFTEVLRRIKNYELELSDVFVGENEDGGDIVNVGFMDYTFYFEAENKKEVLTRFNIQANTIHEN